MSRAMVKIALVSLVLVSLYPPWENSMSETAYAWFWSKPSGSHLDQFGLVWNFSCTFLCLSVLEALRRLVVFMFEKSSSRQEPSSVG